MLVKRQIPMLRLLEDGSSARYGTVWVDEVRRIEGRATALTLVSIGVVILAPRTCTYYIAVGEELPSLGVVVLLRLLLCKGTLIIKCTEEGRGVLPMGRARRTAIDVEGHTEASEGVSDNGVITIHYILWGNSLLLRTDSDGHTVLIAPADEEHLLPLEPQVASVDICWDVDPSKVSDMHWPVGIGKGGRDECSLIVLLHR